MKEGTGLETEITRIGTGLEKKKEDSRRGRTGWCSLGSRVRFPHRSGDEGERGVKAEERCL